jgi:hypothetical protein
MERRVCKTICEAIRKRSLLAFVYRGKARVVAPYCHGFKKNTEVLRAIQVRGVTSSGFGFGKLWHVANVSDLRILDEAFIPDDPNYNPNDSAMDRIHCRV